MLRKLIDKVVTYFGYWTDLDYKYVHDRYLTATKRVEELEEALENYTTENANLVSERDSYRRKVDTWTEAAGGKSHAELAMDGKQWEMLVGRLQSGLLVSTTAHQKLQEDYLQLVQNGVETVYLLKAVWPTGNQVVDGVFTNEQYAGECCNAANKDNDIGCKFIVEEIPVSRRTTDAN